MNGLQWRLVSCLKKGKDKRTWMQIEGKLKLEVKLIPWLST